MEKLVEILKIETESLKVEFVERSMQYAKAEHARMVERSEWNNKQWCEFLNVEPSKIERFDGSVEWTFPKNFWNTADARRHHKLFWAMRKIVSTDVEVFIEKARIKAVSHYEFSIQKLAIRLMKKELNIDKLKATTSHIGVNIETTLTDGEKTVRAFTIIAGGPIQQPHYRYLIK